MIRVAALCVLAISSLVSAAGAAPCVGAGFDLPFPGAVGVETKRADVPSAQFPGLWQEGLIDGYPYQVFANYSGLLREDVLEFDWSIALNCQEAPCTRVVTGTPPALALDIAKRLEQCITPPVKPKPKAEATAAKPAPENEKKADEPAKDAAKKDAAKAKPAPEKAAAAEKPKQDVGPKKDAVKVDATKAKPAPEKPAVAEKPKQDVGPKKDAVKVDATKAKPAPNKAAVAETPKQNVGVGKTVATGGGVVVGPATSGVVVAKNGTANAGQIYQQTGTSNGVGYAPATSNGVGYAPAATGGITYNVAPSVGGGTITGSVTQCAGPSSGLSCTFALQEDPNPIVTLQRLLVLAGARSGKIDGIYGRQTQRAVVEVLGYAGRDIDVPTAVARMKVYLCQSVSALPKPVN